MELHTWDLELVNEETGKTFRTAKVTTFTYDWDAAFREGLFLWSTDHKNLPEGYTIRVSHAGNNDVKCKGVIQGTSPFKE